MCTARFGRGSRVKRELGIVLVDRCGRGVVEANGGRIFLVLAAAASFVASSREWAELYNARIRIGCNELAFDALGCVERRRVVRQNGS